jgi:hypothetical protein
LLLIKKLYFGGLVVLPLILVLLPANYFDTGQSLCLSQLFFQKECFGCGITRAVQHFIHFEFAQAWKFNKLVVIVIPITVFIWLQQVYLTYLAIRDKKTPGS